MKSDWKLERIIHSNGSIQLIIALFMLFLIF